MSEPKGVKRLVERFERNRDAYRSSDYNEAQARLELINPLFKALGWDMYNEAGYAEAFKDVVHEDAIKIRGATKAPDYCFRIGGTRKFFVEAKRPSVGIKDDPIPAYQLRRYAWSAKLPLSILTDFEEFAVYDCRIKPAKADKASAARILYLTYTEYAKRWDEIAGIFSREEILKGSFDRYAESTKRKRGTAEVDDAFLKEIENWRDVLARNIALRNADLSTRELNFAVQRTIDRIIFLRICEDRGIEDYGQLMALQSGMRAYNRLCQIFRRADERYNSGLFHFRKDKDRLEPPDGLTLSLTVDDKVLKEVFKDLYYPDSPYEFSVLPADILGHIYEQFLGKVIRLTAGHHAKVEDKPEVKKAGGVYYTPTYIVDYIVNHTVGQLLEGKTPQKASKLRILDPACGSGSFLLGAYQTLLDWHLDWYSEHDAEKHAKGRQPKIFHGPGGDWRLTTAEKKRILLNNIYGVDIDTQAVEVTKLSLLLKVLEGENEETIGQSLRLFHERALPDLGENIKCGNSLIGPDFYEGKQLSLIDEEERYRINAFDWNAEFPEIMGTGGFDAVIGNPPYVRGRSLQRELKDYYLEAYSTFTANSDIFIAFLERAFIVLDMKGILGFIIPRSYLTETYAARSREHFLRTAHIAKVVDFKGVKVFNRATITNVIIVVQKQHGTGQMIQITDWSTQSTNQLPQEQSLAMPKSVIRTDLVGVKWRVYRKAQNAGIQLGVLCYVSYSVAAHSEVENKRKDAYIFTERVDEKCVRFIEAREIQRFYITYTGRWLRYDPKIVRRPGLPELFDAQKIMVRDVVGDRGLVCALDETGLYADYSIVCLTLKSNIENVTSRNLRWSEEELKTASQYSMRYLLGLVNSRLLNFVFRSGIGGGLHVYPGDLRQLPIRAIEFENPRDRALHDNLGKLVDTMLKLHKNLQAAKTDHEKSLIQRQIDATDKQIDKLVYELYGLTDKEIRIVEETTK